jgi:O-antigen/teichoic acid export membrane protein
MLVYALLDPLRVLVAGMLTALGYPGRVLVSHLLQLAVLLVAVPTLGSRYGIDGVAMAVNLMALAGIVAIFILARPLVDFSHRALWLAPSLGLGLGVAAGALAANTSWARGHDLRSGGMKLLAFGGIYIVVLLLLERRRLQRLARTTMAHLRPVPPVETGS